MSEPIAIQVTRYRCPTCPRSGSSKTRMRQHAESCWYNPANRSCKTCQHFEPYAPPSCDGPESPETCAAGQQLPIVERDYGPTTTLKIHCEAWEGER